MVGSTHFELQLPSFDAPAQVLIVVSPYYNDVAKNMVSGAVDVIAAAGCTHDLINVPGALEIPTAIKLASSSRRFDGFVALGCVVRGETSHYDTVCNDSSRGLSELGLQGLCIGNGILTVENMSQAEVRADPEGQNKGGAAAAAALHLIALKRRFQKENQ